MTNPDMNTTSFSELLARVQPDAAPGACSAEISEDWLQGRSGFGGLMGALAMTALRKALAEEPGEERPLRALMTAFVGPAGAGPVSIRCKPLRSGKSVTWAQVDIAQNDAICTTVTACLGGDRASAISVAPGRRPQAPAPEDCRLFPFLPGITPSFTRHFELRWASGEMPMSGSDESQMGVWLRFRDAGEISEAHVVALMDVLPPAVLQMFKQMKPISSLSWHLQMLEAVSAEDLGAGDGWWFVGVSTDSAANGYAQQQAVLYTPAGRALAISQQAVAVFA